ncbi:MAG: hypothetical protein HY698_16690 [Deltaproteobacteria bacterium]|nr:hypothetical protein [Deltaproteobacteria bacterium]
MCPKTDDELTPEDMERLLSAVIRIRKRRRVALLGYLVALVTLLVGIPWSLVAYARGPRGMAGLWVMVMPILAVGLVLWIFGKWSRKA